jgi:nitroreductase
MTELLGGKRAITDADVHPLLVDRWSPRWYDAEAEVSERALLAMLEAARWAPSFGNTQPARYLVGKRGDDTYRRILDVLIPKNRSWAQAAGALLLGVAMTRNEKGEVPYAEYSTGLATENLVVQAVADGLAARQMAGFDADAAREVFALPEEAKPLVAIAVGVAGDLTQVPDDLRERELAPRKRLPLSEIAFGPDWGEPAF